MSFSGAIYVRTVDRDAVLYAARGLGRPLHVGPLQNGWVIVLPDLAGQDLGVSQKLARRLTAPMMHVIRHDDLTMYVWYELGRLVETYESDPQYFQSSSRARQRRVQGARSG